MGRLLIGLFSYVASALAVSGGNAHLYPLLEYLRNVLVHGEGSNQALRSAYSGSPHLLSWSTAVLALQEPVDAEGVPAVLTITACHTVDRKDMAPCGQCQTYTAWREENKERRCLKCHVKDPFGSLVDGSFRSRAHVHQGQKAVKE